MTDQDPASLPAVTDPSLTEQQSARQRAWRMGVAFAVAGASDLLSVWLEAWPPAQWLLDVVTAGLLFLVLGRQWLILPGLIAEAIPGLAIFPSWLLVVGSVGMFGTVHDQGRKAS
jgi:hypothetical protein